MMAPGNPCSTTIEGRLMPQLIKRQIGFKNARGPAALFGATVVFAIFDSMLKYLTHHLPAGEIILVRFSLGLIISAPFMIRHVRSLDARSLVLLITRGLLGGMGLFSLLHAFRLGTLSGSMVLLSTNPIWALILSALLLREPLTRQRVAGVVTAFLGAVLVIAPWQGGMAPGDLLGLVTGVSVGASMVVIRHLRARFDSFVIYGFHSLVGIAVAIPLMAHEPLVLEPSMVIVLLAASLLGFLGQLGMNYGLRFVRAAEGAVILMTESILTVIIGVLVFHEDLGLNFLVGAAMILGSGAVLAMIGVYESGPSRGAPVDAIRGLDQGRQLPR